MFTKAIVRLPSANFAKGLTSVNMGTPDHGLALEQHEAYCAALERCGLTLTRLEADPHYPDSTFVEDTAVLTERCAILTRPGAPSRAGEVEVIGEVLGLFYSSILNIQQPGTLDGGDVCQAGDHFFIGVSARTNESGAQQLTDRLALFDYTSSLVDIRDMNGILHLKSGLAYLGHKRLVVVDALAKREEFRSYDLVRVHVGDEHAANCMLVNDYVLMAARHPAIEEKLQSLGYKTIVLNVSEFQKMDGGLSCLSLRI